MKKEAKATKPQIARLNRMLEAERALLLVLLPMIPDPEGLELLLMLLGDPELELLKPPGLLVLVLAG